MLCRIPLTLIRLGGARRLAPSRPAMGNVVITNFHSTSHLWAKSKHGKKAKVSDDNDDDDEEEEETDSKKQKKGRKNTGADGDSIEIPDMKSRETTMEGRIDRLNQELSKIRAGRASADMFNHIVVEINGSKVSLPELCQVTMKTSSKVSIAVFDPTLVSKVSTGILECGLGLNPSVDGNTVVVDVPKPSKEARDSLVKAAQKIAEKTKIEIRNVRKDFLDVVKKLKSSISEDDVRRMSKEVDALTEKKVDKVTKLLEAKSKELLS